MLLFLLNFHDVVANLLFYFILFLVALYAKSLVVAGKIGMRGRGVRISGRIL